MSARRAGTVVTASAAWQRRGRLGGRHWAHGGLPVPTSHTPPHPSTRICCAGSTASRCTSHMPSPSCARRARGDRTTGRWTGNAPPAVRWWAASSKGSVWERSIAQPQPGCTVSRLDASQNHGQCVDTMLHKSPASPCTHHCTPAHHHLDVRHHGRRQLHLKKVVISWVADLQHLFRQEAAEDWAVVGLVAQREVSLAAAPAVLCSNRPSKNNGRQPVLRACTS